MNSQRIPTRRKPERQTLYARLFNQPRTKKQRAAAAHPTAEDFEEGGINISRSLTIIFAIHIIAIGMIFVHKQYLSGRTTAPEVVEAPAPVAPKAEPTPVRNDSLPVLGNGDRPYLVRKGDNYAVIAAKHGVDESELREMNRGTDIRAGVVLRIPERKRIVAETPPEVAAIRDQSRLSDAERGLVEILPAAPDESAQLIRPALSRSTPDPVSSATGSARRHIVKSGENIWRISNQYKVGQKELMEANGIKDPTKLKIGQILKIP